MRRTKPIVLALSCLAAAPLIAIAVDLGAPSTQPSIQQSAPVDPQASTGGLDDSAPPAPGENKPDENRPHHGERFGDGPLARRFSQGFAPSVTPAEIADARKYMTAHSPNRLAAIDSLPEGKRKSAVMELATRNYVNWMRVFKDDPQLYAVIVKRVSLEDDIFGLVTQLRKESADKTELKNQLKDKVTKLVDLGIQERQLRLDRLEKTVAQEQKKLADDSANRSTLVDDRLKNIMNEDKGLSLGNGQGRNHPASHPGG